MLTLVVVVAALCGIVAPSAAGHAATIDTQHTLNLRAGIMSGQLTAAAPECLSARQITLYRIAATAGTAVASATTDNTGAWTRATSDLQDGDYYATAAAKVVTKQGRKLTCAAATSNTVTLAVDADNDGYTTGLGDCNDANPAVHPGATEVLNGIDDDCDGSVDEGTATGSTTCWTPASDPVGSPTTWSQIESTQPCTWQLMTWTVLPGAVYMVSDDWLIEHRPAAGGPVAFEYDGQGWTYYATHPNSIYGGN